MILSAVGKTLAWLVSLAFLAVAGLCAVTLVHSPSLISTWGILFAAIIGMIAANPLIAGWMRLRHWRKIRVGSVIVLIIVICALGIVAIDESESHEMIAAMGISTDEFNNVVEIHNRAIESLKTDNANTNAIRDLGRACIIGLPVSCAKLGYISNLQKDFVRAVSYFDKGCHSRIDPKVVHNIHKFDDDSRDDPDVRPSSCLNAGITSNQLGKIAAAINYFEPLCAGPSNDAKARACAELGTIYSRDADPSKLAKGIELLTLACDADDPEGCHNLAMRYMAGSGVTYDPSKAEQLALKACSKGTDNKKASCELVETIRSSK